MNFKKIIVILLIYLNLLSQVSAGIFISEIMPNTTDDVNLEYIELTNSGILEQFLSGYIIKDKSEKEFLFSSGYFLDIGESKKFYRPETKILLNNSDEELYLYDNFGELVDSFFYDETEKGIAIKTLIQNSLIKGESSNSGNVEINTGIIDIGTGVINNTGSINNSTGVINQGTGIIEINTGIINVNSGIVDFGTGNFDYFSGSLIEIPEIEIEIQSGLDYLTGNIWECKKEFCKINLSVDNIFTGTYLKNNYECLWSFGTGSIYSTGTELKCNPGYVDYGNGIFDVGLKVFEKDNGKNFKTGGIVINNNILLLGNNIDNGTGMTLPPTPLLIEEESNSRSVDVGTGIVEEKFEEFDVKYSFQNPTYLIEKNQIVDIYNCDRSKEECKINLDFRDSFTGSIKESNFECSLDYGFGSGILTGEENKCNPGSFLVPVGEFNFNFLIQNKTNTGYFSTGSFRVINEGYLKPVKKSTGGSSSSSKSSSKIIKKININKPEIIIQSGLLENNLCKKEDCKINLNYENEHSNLACKWDFDGGNFKTTNTDKKCNPGYVSYGTGEYKIKLRVYQKDLESNYEEVFLEFGNETSPQPSPLEEREQEQNLENNDEIEENFVFDFERLKKIRINKLMPNPKGTDNLEYIELINNTDEIINLKGCSLDDKKDGGSKIYLFENDNYILANKTKKFYKSDTKLNLNNDKDEVTLICGSNLIDKLSWDFNIPSGYYLNHNRLEIESSKVKIIDVIDGDTVKIKFPKNGHIETLRFIGVDTPETKHPNKKVETFGIEASNFTKDNILGKEVYLEIDKNNFRDKYSRLLGFIFIDNKNFNQILIEKGYAKTYIKYDFTYINDFIKSEEKAKKNKIGMWNITNNFDDFGKEKINTELIEEEKIDLVDLNINGIPDEFEELKVQSGIILENLTGSLDLYIDEEESKQKYIDFIDRGFTIGYRKLKSGLKIYGKTIPNSKIQISIIESKKFSFIDYFILSANADYFYNTKSDENGNYEFLLTDISSGNIEIKSRVIDDLGNEVKIEKNKKIILDSEYLSEMKEYVYSKYMKKVEKYSDETKITPPSIPPLTGEGSKNLFSIIDVQGKIGVNKKIVGDNIYCYDTCSINFNGSNSTGNIEKYLWNFGNGEIFEGKNPKYIKYEKIGKYNVSLILIGENGDEIQSNKQVIFSKKTKAKKSENTIDNKIKTSKNFIIESEAKIINTDENEQSKNNNGILYYLVIIIFSIFLLFMILKKEKLI